MTLLENIYHHLQHNRLVKNREHFSTHYLGKSKNWYAVQTHERRDFSTSAAITCLNNIRFGLDDAQIDETQKLALRTAEQLVLYFLQRKHALTIS
jgi:hypothetical protein